MLTETRNAELTIVNELLRLKIDKLRESEDEYRLSIENLNRQVDELTAKLETADVEFDSLMYSVSHDLRSPLNAIGGFSQLLLKEYSGELDRRGQDFIHRIRKSNERLCQLIDGILGLSRLARRQMCIEAVDLSALAQKVVPEIKWTGMERQVEFVIEEGIIANADAYMMQIVLDNLLRNAWKFTANHSSAKIEFGKVGSEGKATYFIRDDGAGFNMAYAKKLFGLFGRLHPETDFEGNGIGLVTVKRIIDNHGGHIWAEGEIEKGATFYFTLC